MLSVLSVRLYIQIDLQILFSPDSPPPQQSVVPDKHFFITSLLNWSSCVWVWGARDLPDAYSGWAPAVGRWQWNLES